MHTSVNYLNNTLLSPLIEPAKLQEKLPDNHLIYKEIIDSTNQYLLDNYPQLPAGTLCVAEAQTAGRGRRGRVWYSPFAGQIIFSLYQQIPKTTSLSGLSLVVGIAVVNALHQRGYTQVKLKWSNDLLLISEQGAAKLGGILIEMSAKEALFYDVVIGVGLNVVVDTTQQQRIDQPIAQLADIHTGREAIDRTEILSEIIQQLNLAIEQFTHSGFTPFLAQWHNYDAYLNQPVQVIQGEKVIKGTNLGVDQQGQLRLATEKGITVFHSGEVSLRLDKFS